MTTKRPQDFRHLQELADGAMVLGLSFGRDVVRAKVIKGGTVRWRRYRHDQQVPVAG